MKELPETRESLLLQVRDSANREAWRDFCDLYRPAIFRIALSRGLQDSDAHDLSQQVLLAVSTAIKRWETKPDGKFRHWLRRVTRNAIVNALTRRPRDRASGGTSIQELLNEVVDSTEDTDRCLRREVQRELYLRAAETVQRDIEDRTWRAFSLTALEGQPAAKVAEMLSLSIGAVYSARSRVMYRLRETVKSLESES